MADDAADREKRLDVVLHACMQVVDAGQPVDQDELCRQHPELAADLRAFFADQDRMDQLARSIRQQRPTEPATLPAVDPLPNPTLGPQQSPSSARGTRVRYFGDYELLEEIARGGMGVVYKARQVSLNRLVALKMI